MSSNIPAENTELIKMVLKTQEYTNLEISEIKKSMQLLVRLDEKMINQQSATERLGSSIDRANLEIAGLRKRLTVVETVSGTRGRFLIWTASLVSAIVTGICILIFGRYLQ